MTKDQIIVLHPLTGCDESYAVQSLLRNLLVIDEIDNVAEKVIDVNGGPVQDPGQDLLTSSGLKLLQLRYILAEFFQRFIEIGCALAY